MTGESLLEFGIAVLITSLVLSLLSMTVFVVVITQILTELERIGKWKLIGPLTFLSRFWKLAKEKGPNQNKYQRIIKRFYWWLRVAVILVFIGVGLMVAGKQLM